MGRAAARGASEGIAGSRAPHVWPVVTVLLVFAGVVAAVISAGDMARSETDKSLRSFEQRSSSVAATLQLALQHQDDLVVDAGGLMADPSMSQTDFGRWADAARVWQRYPEMAAIGSVVLVSDADLEVFAARAADDPAGVAKGAFSLVPPGPRSFYCLSTAGVSRATVAAVPAGFDFCADPQTGSVLLDARDSGQGSYTPYTVGGRTWLAVQTPIYRGGATPATVEARRTQFAGWVGTQLDPTALLRSAVKDEPGVSVELRYRAGEMDVAFAGGVGRLGATTETLDLGNGWTVRTLFVVDTSSVTSGPALVRLLGGLALSVLLGLLVFVLGTGRDRARRKLMQRTSQLHHQAMHDALTGLPNRALVIDRIDQMLARDRRYGTSSALLFMDLDDFKHVNDSLGHAAGDLLLIAVADRLSSTQRGADTIGRMGGDEFVALLDGGSLDVGPELAAQRLLDVMRQPFALPGPSSEVTVDISISISIGIATGDRETADELLRDADFALYQAKDAGRNRYATHDPSINESRTDIASPSLAP